MSELSAFEELSRAMVPPLDESEIGDPWTEELPPWTSEPTGPGVAYILRIASEDGRALGELPLCGTQNKSDDFLDIFRNRFTTRGEPTEHHTFVYPSEGYIVAELGDSTSGIYGFLEGVGDWGVMPRHKNATWQVLAVRSSECRPNSAVGVVVAPRAWVVYSGDALGALQIMVPRMVRNPRLLEAAFDDDVQVRGHWVRKESSRTAIGSYTDSVISFGVGETKAFTFGLAKFAIAEEGIAEARGMLGTAIVLNGGFAMADKGYGDAIARSYAEPNFRNPKPVFASAGGSGTAVALGRGATARAGMMGAIFLTEYTDWGGVFPVSVFAGIVDGVSLKPDTWYRLENGKPVECQGPE